MAWKQHVAAWGFVRRMALLAMVLLVYGLATSLLGWWLASVEGLIAASVATLLCFVAGCLALVVLHLFVPPSMAAAHVMVGMMIRMGVPLLMCLAVIQRAPTLVDAGFAWFLVGAFLLTLAAETMISVASVEMAAGVSTNNSAHGTDAATHRPTPASR